MLASRTLSKRDPQSLDNSENSEYDAFEQSVNRALRL